MHQYVYYNLILRYPSLRGFINQCHIGNHIDKLHDFLMGLETGENLRDV